MRIISQDGALDVPYNDYQLFVIGAKYDAKVARIYCQNSYAPSVKIAEYSTNAKALKAMEMLREQYSRIEIIKSLASGTCEHMEESLKPKEFKDILKKYINMEAFQFPQDNEIEV